MSTAAASPIVSGDPVADFRAAAERLSQVLALESWRLSGEQVQEMLTGVQGVAHELDRAEVQLVREGVQRGLHAEQGYGVADWISVVGLRSGLAPDPTRAARVMRMAAAAGRPVARAIFDRFVAGELTLGKADQLARFEQDVAKVADPTELADQLEGLIEAAADGADASGLTPRELGTTIAYAGSLLKPDKLADDEAEAMRQGRSMTKRPGPAGLTDYRLRLDPEGVAVVDAAMADHAGP